MAKVDGKKDWTSPELTVLVRNKPEAAVTTGCHNAAGGAGSDQSNADRRCVKPPGCGVDCFAATIS